ncbi:NAD(P)H-dependent glycerol-3-phosphate dehydrogenase [Rickettsia endosymbiont of Halotydeus destructor]|uniref:NAD(P)H-dependent glycerol-3-phosphate dehydrogenase n=1 Tax=Rickettsia endosymbiont of Halotydeus destructor TaxID=2996754 RepID=UPI003BB1420A
MFKNIAIYGGGSFGTALACQVARCYSNAALFLRDNDIASEINIKKTNSKYLGKIILPNNIVASTDLFNIKDFEVIIIATPSSVFEDTIKLLKASCISSNTVLLIATKGFAKNPTELLSNRIKSILLDNPVAFLAGPNLAKEIVQGLLTSATIASSDKNLADKLAASLASKFFITTTSDDIVTLQVAGAIKNIIAIKSGLYEAEAQGENARALLITEALKEISILSKALGGMQSDSDILLKPGVAGDLILTCYSRISRNARFGYELGTSRDKKKFLQEYKSLVEGREAIKLVLDFIQRYNLSLPVISSVASELELL